MPKKPLYLLFVSVLAGFAVAQADSVVMPQATTDRASQPERLDNPDFEHMGEGWQGWMAGFEVVEQGGRNGMRGVRCVATSTDQQHGVMQLVALNQERPRPVVVTGWSRAESVDGMSDTGYAVYLDITYRDGDHLWAQTACFSVGTHDWEKRRVLLSLPKPIQTISVLGLFRGHNGTVYFDDFSCVEFKENQGIFEGVPVGELSGEETDSGALLRLSAEPNVLFISQNTGAIAPLAPNGTLPPGKSIPVFVRDVAADSDFIAPQWTVSCPQEGVVRMAGESQTLQLSFDLEVKSNPSIPIVISGTVRDLRGEDRAITLYLPIPMSGDWTWWNDMRRSMPAQGFCINAFRTGAGATGTRSSYPLAVLTNPKNGVMLAVPIEEPRHHRLAYDAQRHLLYAAFDFGLSPATKRAPGAATFRAELISYPGAHGFRGALYAYYQLCAEAFKKRTGSQGLWMAFTDIATLPQPEDFGFAFQEGGANIAWDDQHSIRTFLYTEPMTTWFKLPREVPRTYDGAMNQLRALQEKKDDPLHESAKIVDLSSVHGSDGKSILQVVNAPWCDGSVFALNADPSIPVTESCPVNRGQAEIRRFEKEVEEPHGDLHATADGAYIDSYEFWANSIDYCREHWAGTDIPLVFDAQTHRVGMLTAFSTFAFQRELAKSMHARRKLVMANGAFAQYDLPAAYIDVLGTETNWMPGGVWTPMTDAELCFRRALSYQKPYCFLMNTHYADFSLELTERYFQRALAYGMFPGFFSENAATDCYFANPQWYEPARPLFKKYVPLIKTIAQAGWQPVTMAQTDDAQVYVERFGQPETGTIYFTLLNDSTQPRTAHLNFDCAALGLMPEKTVLRELIADRQCAWDKPGTCTLTFAPEQAALLRLAR